MNESGQIELRLSGRRQRAKDVGTASHDGLVTDLPIPKSVRSGIIWPAIPDPANGRLLALQQQFEQSQWWPVETLRQHQLHQLEQLLAHAVGTVPFYRDRLRPLAGLSPGGLTMEAFRQIPVLRRTEVQEAGPAHISNRLPKGHGRMIDIRTTGSTGQPVAVKGTAITGQLFRALNLRYHLWHGRDFSGKVAAIRSLMSNTLTEAAKSGRPCQWVAGYPSGPMFYFDVTRPVSEQLIWLECQNPDYLLTYPSNLLALLRCAEDAQVMLPRLRQVCTMSEVLDPRVHADCERVWGAPVVDIYACQETGIIAIQCPIHHHYHVQAESLLVEVLDSSGEPCAPGQIGRVIVTDLHNFATPMIRYELGDYAEAGVSCSCGRNLPVLNRILGRSRNMLTLPSGEQFWPSFPAEILMTVEPVRQVQLVQRNLREIDVILAACADTSPKSSKSRAGAP